MIYKSIPLTTSNEVLNIWLVLTFRRLDKNLIICIFHATVGTVNFVSILEKTTINKIFKLFNDH